MHQRLASLKNLPNALTLSRVLAIPIILSCLFWLPDSLTCRMICALVFFLISFTDLMDGYLARRMGAESNFGRCFDPIADKILVVSVLFALASIKKADIIPSMLITCREILISGVREFALQHGVTIKVSNMSKWKTALQFISITVILLSSRHSIACDIGNLILWIATVLAIVSAYEYTSKCRLLSK